MSFDPSHLLSQLSAMDREKGDIKLQCQGDEVKAHSFVLGMRSKYFDTALNTGVGNAKSKTEMNVEDCSPEVLTCAVNFMYGIPIPEDFLDIQGLLHQADLFMMEDLKTAVGSLIAKALCLDTVKETALLAEKYREVTLQETCGAFILANIEELEDELLSELALCMPSVAGMALQAVKESKKKLKEKEESHERALAQSESKSKEEITVAKGECAKEIQIMKEEEKKLNCHIQEIGLKVLGIHNNNQFKKRVDFPPDVSGSAEHKVYVRGKIEANMLVRCWRAFTATCSTTGGSKYVGVGDIGRIINPQSASVQVKWQSGVTIKQVDCFASLELLTSPINTSFLA